MGTTSNNTTLTSFDSLNTSFSSSKLIPSINKFISSSSPSPSPPLHSLNSPSLSITTHPPLESTINPSSLITFTSALITHNINSLQSHSIYHSILSLRHEKPKQQITIFNNINKLFNINHTFKVKPRQSHSNLNKTYKTCSSEYSNNKSIYSSIIDIDTSSINRNFKRTISSIVRTKTNKHITVNHDCAYDNDNNNNGYMRLHKKNTFNHLLHRTKRCFNLNNDVQRLANVTIKEEKEIDKSNICISELKLRKGKTVLSSLKEYNETQRTKLNQNELKRSLLSNSKKYAEQLRHSVLIKKSNELGNNKCVLRKHKGKTVHEKSLMYFLNENLAQSILDNCNCKHNKWNSNRNRQMGNNIYKVDIKQLANMKESKYESSVKKLKQNKKRKSQNNNKVLTNQLDLSNDSVNLKLGYNKQNANSIKCQRFISKIDYLLNVDQSYKRKLQRKKFTKANTTIINSSYTFINKNKPNTIDKPPTSTNLTQLPLKPKDKSEHESIDNNYKTVYTKENLITKEATITEDDDDSSFMEYLNEP